MDSMDASITLPHNEMIHNFGNARQFTMDIGGSLTKLAYYSTVQYEVTNVRSEDHTAKEALSNSYEISQQKETTMSLHFMTFENAYIETCLDFIKGHLMNGESNVIKATGGGSHTFKEAIEKKLGLKMNQLDENTCVIKGCNFVLRNIPDEAFVYIDSEIKFQKTHPDIFPYLLVDIGSGVSIFKVESEDKFRLTGGSLISGRTFWGLGKLLTKTKSFNELLQLASKGQHSSVDLLVKDIYVGSYCSYAGDIIAASFGKPATTDQEFSKEDLASSLLRMVSHDIGQVACLHAKLHNISRVYFGGSFTRWHPVTMRIITNIVTFSSKGDIQPIFLRHEGYLGVIGASLKEGEEGVQ